MKSTWTKSQSCRWLDERSEQVLAWVRRRDPERAPWHSHQMGRWLKDEMPSVFARAHLRLSVERSGDPERTTVNLWKTLN